MPSGASGLHNPRWVYRAGESPAAPVIIPLRRTHAPAQERPSVRSQDLLGVATTHAINTKASSPGFISLISGKADVPVAGLLDGSGEGAPQPLIARASRSERLLERLGLRWFAAWSLFVSLFSARVSVACLF